MDLESIRAPLDRKHVEAGPVKSFLALAAGSFPLAAEPFSTPSTSFGAFPTHLRPCTAESSQHTLKKNIASFDPEVVEQLQRTNPEVLAWLRSRCGILFQVVLIFVYILFYTAGGLLLSFALKPDPPPKFKPLPSSMIVVDSALTFVVGLVITLATLVFSAKMSLANAVKRTCHELFQWRVILAYSLVATLIKISATFGLLAYSKLDAGLKVVLDQLRLPVTAAMSYAIVGRKYGMHEWLALLIVLLAVCIFYLAGVEHDEVTELHTKCRYPPHCFSEPPYDVCALRVDGPTILGTVIKDEHNVNGTLHDITTFAVKASKTDSAGLVFSLVATFFNCVGSLFLEKAFKSTASTPFPMQMMQKEVIGFPIAVAMSFILPLWVDSKGGKAIWWTKNDAEGSGMGFFQGFTGLALLAIAVDNFLGWMGGIIIKQFSSVVKIIAKCFVLVFMVFCTGTFLKKCEADALPVTMYCLAFVIGFATVLFAIVPKDLFAPPFPSTRAVLAQEPAASHDDLSCCSLQLEEVLDGERQADRPQLLAS